MEERKDIILNKAITLFAQKGFEAVGVQEICNHSEITKPTLYYYFGNKQGILEAIRESYGNQLLNNLSQASYYEHDFIKGLTQILKAEINYALKNPIFYNLHTSLLHAPKESESFLTYKSLYEEHIKIYEEFFILSANEFGNMKGKEKLYALIFKNTVNSSAHEILNGTLINNDDTIYKIIHSFVYGVAS